LSDKNITHKETDIGENKDNEMENRDVNKNKDIRNLIKLADDEMIVRDYFVANREKQGFGELHYVVTNKRVIMYIWSDDTIQIKSVKIADIVSTAVYKTKYSFSIIINIKAATGALTFYSTPKGFLERRLKPEDLNLKVKQGPDLGLMAKELGALILNMRKKL
jgi:hypothetical protein